MLMEALRKLWTGLLVDEVTSSLQRHSSLSLSQHGYLPHHGTDTANLQLLNTLETAWDARRPLYGSSWDTSKAFDSVSKPLIVLATARRHRISSDTRSGMGPPEVRNRHRGTFKSLGVLYPINHNDSTFLQLMKQKLIVTTSVPCPSSGRPHAP